MSYFLKRIFAVSLQVFVAYFMLSQAAKAQATRDNLDSPVYMQNTQQDMMRNQPSVSELSNIEVSDWKFKILEYFIKRYRIKTGYPPEILQRQGEIRRDEFAFLLNSVIQHFDKYNQ